MVAEQPVWFGADMPPPIIWEYEGKNDKWVEFGPKVHSSRVAPVSGELCTLGANSTHL